MEHNISPSRLDFGVISPHAAKHRIWIFNATQFCAISSIPCAVWKYLYTCLYIPFACLSLLQENTQWILKVLILEFMYTISSAFQMFCKRDPWTVILRGRCMSFRFIPESWQRWCASLLCICLVLVEWEVPSWSWNVEQSLFFSLTCHLGLLWE